jgi:tRNA modification GTPase
MFSRDDTIAAIATPAGRGGLGVIRISGPAARSIAARLLNRRSPLSPRLATFAHVVDPASGRRLDQIVATWFQAPGSFTGEDVVELSAHGSPVVVRQILERVLAAGARLAEPGEFSLRAYLNGRIDLVQAEAIADLVAAVTPLQARAAFDQLEGTLTEAIGAIDRSLFDLCARLEASIDFAEEPYHFVDAREAARELEELDARMAELLRHARRGRLVRDGATVAIAGTPNVGKSSLFNALVGASRAIVTATPGTTRDLVTETVDLSGVPVTIVDTAGLRDASDDIEREGMERARQAMSVADAVIVVLDRSRPLADGDRRVLADTASVPSVVVVNKVDLAPAWEGSPVGDDRPVVPVSAASGAGIADVGRTVVGAIARDAAPRDVPAVTNLRHVALIERARAAVRRAVTAVSGEDGALSEEFILVDLQEARAALEHVTGRRTTEDVLRRIFERFCIGK